jgi:hypothetical protein
MKTHTAFMQPVAQTISSRFSNHFGMRSCLSMSLCPSPQISFIRSFRVLSSISPHGSHVQHSLAPRKLTPVVVPYLPTTISHYSPKGSLHSHTFLEKSTRPCADFSLASSPITLFLVDKSHHVFSELSALSLILFTLPSILHTRPKHLLVLRSVLPTFTRIKLFS